MIPVIGGVDVDVRATLHTSTKGLGNDPSHDALHRQIDVRGIDTSTKGLGNDPSHGLLF